APLYPVFRIFSLSSFNVMIGAMYLLLLLLLYLAMLNHPYELCFHLFDTLIGIHLDKFMHRIIVLEQLNSLMKKDVQSFLYCFPLVIGALVQRATIDITDPRNLGRTGLDVVHMLVCAADIAS